MGATFRSLRNPRSFSPISATEFANSFLSIWERAGSYKHGDTLGIAVSGGVDSMALASICSQMQRTPYDTLQSLLKESYDRNANGSPLARYRKFQAFVVDHGIRKGSNSEARAVLNILEARDIPTKILTIDWAGDETPADLPNFESLARRHRFQALGKACRDQGIDSLILAHHQDDQAETVMMRLINGHRMAGMTGMAKFAEIPECYGLHGIHESGGTEEMGRTSSLAGLATMSTPLMPLKLESGGVKIYRPLLGFSKQRLIATCEENGMDWFEDHTNKDPTVTMRNAIRYLYSNNALPVALSKSALLQLATKSVVTKEATLRLTNDWLRQCTIKLETRPGTLKVRFVNLDQYDGSRLDVNVNYATSLLLRRIAMLITPQEHVNLSSLVTAIERVFPEWFSSREVIPPSTTFTAAGLLFRVIAPPRFQPDGRVLEKCEWLVSRQPNKATALLPRFEIPADSKALASKEWSSWLLYDGRFWIRVQNLSNEALVIRPPNELDLATVHRSSLWKGKRRSVQYLLSRFAPGNIRWTLPAIVMRDTNGSEKLLALPTLDVGVAGVEKVAKWQVRFKKVDIDILTTSNIK